MVESPLERLGRFNAEEQALIGRAYKFARVAHASQQRLSGEPYLNHPTFVAQAIIDWGLDAATVAGALLHDVAEDTKYDLKDIGATFGEEIAFLVDGITKVGRIKYRGNQAQTETLKKMILAISADLRVVFIKLADRWHNMKTLAALPTNKQKRIALETSEIYAPLAYRLGMGYLSGELEDLSFPYLYPQEYRWLTENLKEHLEQSEKYLQQVSKIVEGRLKEMKIPILQLSARAKRLASLYKKLKRTGMNLEQIYDLVALRIIVPSVEDCYATLGLVHKLYPPLPGKIKDYIALPKPNGYRSLHTTVICEENKPTEFQIRTEGMHRENEHGQAAYWAYQTAKNTAAYAERAPIFADRKLEWINQLANWQKNLDRPDEFLSSLKIDFFQDRIFVITPKGEVIDLPSGSTPIDFAFAIHSDIGEHCVGAKVNDKLVALDHELQSGDAVEIITARSKKPSESWLEFAHTSKARTRIRSALRSYQGPTLRPKTVAFKIAAEDRIGLLKDITAVFARAKLNITATETQGKAGTKYRGLKLNVNVSSRQDADRVLLKLKKIKEIKEVSYTFRI